jgi:ketosteroid isomerase-like protein
MDRVSTSALLIEEVRRRNEQWMESYVNLDFAFLYQHLSDDYVSTFPDGTVLDKKGEIELLQSGDVAFAAMKPLEMKVRVFGETAVITGRSAIRAMVKGRDESGEFRFTDVWAKQDGRWQAVATKSHVSLSPRNANIRDLLRTSAAA